MYVRISQPRWIPEQRLMGRSTSPTLGWRPSLFDPEGGFLCMGSEGGRLDLKNEK